MNLRRYTANFRGLSRFFFTLPVLMVVLLLLAPVASSQPVDQPFMGFLALRSQSPLQQLRFGMQHHVPWTLPTGDMALYLEHNWKNVWMYGEGEYQIDAEIHELAVRSCFGLGGDLEASIEIPFRYVSGGFLDVVIENFHDLLGIGNANREKAPRDQFSFEINPTGQPDGWSRAGDEHRNWNFGNIILGFNYSLSRLVPDPLQVAATVNVKLPTGSRTEYSGGQSLDVGLSMCVGRAFGPVYAYLSPGVVYYDDNKMIGVDLRRWHYSIFLALEYHRPDSPRSLIVQALMERGIATSFSEFTENTYEIIFAYKRHIGRATVLEIGFLENLFFFDNSPDIGFHFGITRILQL